MSEPLTYGWVWCSLIAKRRQTWRPSWSAFGGTFETYHAGPTMSVHRGRPEVTGRRLNDATDHITDVAYGRAGRSLMLGGWPSTRKVLGSGIGLCVSLAGAPCDAEILPPLLRVRLRCGRAQRLRSYRPGRRRVSHTLPRKRGRTTDPLMGGSEVG
jgi:hypothetical protein